MLWEVEIRPLGNDPEAARVNRELSLLTHSDAAPVERSARGFLFEGDIDREGAERLARELLVDAVVEEGDLRELGVAADAHGVTVLPKPGVMDPVAQSVTDAAADLGLKLQAVRTFRRYFGSLPEDEAGRELLFRKVLANEAIEQVVVGRLEAEHITVGTSYQFRRVEVPLRDLDDAGLERISREGQLALDLAEMRAIRDHFRDQGRDPTDVELETLAQTWSEHCSHKTLKGRIEYTATVDGQTQTRRFENLLKETVFAATEEVRQLLGGDDWCVSVFADNAGVVTFDDEFHACFKVETHNHPSAIEPYGGANTGIGGVIRDPLGTGLGAWPVCNTDVFCFAPPDFPPERLPAGVLHPRRVMQGVVAGVRDYGNRMGIPTVNGAIVFDERYLGNPLVFCGTVGMIPVGRVEKRVRPGDLIVAVGGRTGRDGIHGATFSSLELTTESETLSGGAVQIGNAITEKKVLDVVIQARDRGLYSAITDCGAGGFSSAVGEMGADVGARVELEKAPLKYDGLTYTEIWISESQERMVLAVPPEEWPELEQLCRGEGVECAAIGTFEATGRLRLSYGGEPVGDLSMEFLHDGRPVVERKAVWNGPARREGEAPASFGSDGASPSRAGSPSQVLLDILSSYSVCSKEWVIRQYDHEVQAGSVIKPLVGVHNDGPSDAAVLTPVLGKPVGLALGCGINPLYADLDPRAMAACAIDEAIRNVVAVGADPERTAILDNFCWGDVRRPESLGTLVRAAEACREVAVAYRTPFISGKDSLNNEFRSESGSISIPGTLLVSAMGRVPDVRRCMTMDLKEAGNELWLVGPTHEHLGGSHLHLVRGESGGHVPMPDLGLAPRIFRAVHRAITGGLVRSCHDLSEGGLAVAVAEMAFAGGVGAEVPDLGVVPGPLGVSDEARMFGESPTRFLLEVRPGDVFALKQCLEAIPAARVGTTVGEQRLRIGDVIDVGLSELKEAWQRPLRW